MSAARLDFAPVLQRLLAPFAGHPLLERLFFSSVELAVLALLVFAAIRVGRIRSPRLAALLWLLVLGKPLVSLAIGSPFHLFRMEVPSAVVAAPAPLAQAVPTDPQPPFAMSSSSSADVQSPPEPIVMDEEMAAAPFAPLPEKATPTPATPPVTSAVAVQAPLTHTPSPWNPAKWILGIWLTGVAFFAGLSLLDRARIRRLVRTARKPEPSLADRYAAIAAEMGLKRPAPLRVTDEMEGPALAGSIWSTILIPAWLAEDANEAKLDWALRHELMHFRLRDPWAGLVRELSHMLFYFHPAAWWAGANWKTATEKACDRAIVADEAAARDYAEQLYRILVGIHGRRQAALRTGLFATRTQIGQRIAALLYGPRTAPHLSAVALVVVALVTAVTLSVGGAFADRNAKRDEPANTPAVAATDKTAEPQPAPISASTTSQPAPAPAPDVTFTYAGTVVDDHGKPVAGAKIGLDYWHAAYPTGPVPTLAVTDSKGRFEFSRRERDFADAGLWGPWWLRAMIVATKPGYGLAGRQSIEFETTGRLAAEQHDPSGRRPKDWSNVLKLSLDDVPIHGRILDTDGRPVSGALLETINLWEGQDGSLDTWEATVLRPGAAFRRHWQKLRPINFEDGFTAPNPTLLPTVRTDANGSFTLNGLGRERLADLAVSAPGIETTVVGVRTRRGAFIKVPLDGRSRKFGEEKFYPCDFTLVAGPSVPVEGQVTDAQSHQPLAGVTVKAAPFPFALHRHISAESRISATTDARGRYRLEGLPPGRARLGVFPSLGSRYLMAGVDVQTGMQQRPLAFDIKLAPGIIVRGRATDARTGMPVQGSLQYFAFRTNPHLQEAPGFGQTFGFFPFPQLRYRYRCDADGRFKIPVLPGPGILTFFGDSLERFPVAIGAADIDASQKREHESTLFATAPWDCNAKMFHLLMPLNPQPGTDSLALDVTVRSPATVTGTVRGPDGRPLGNYRLFDDTSFVGEEGHWRSYRDANFETKVYSPADHHWLMFYQRASNLVGFREFTGEPKEPLDITLQRGATLKGRIVENGGQPMGDVSLLITAREAVAHGNRAAEARGAAAAMGRQFDQSQIMVDKNGRFELCAVTPGVAYSASLPRGTVFTNMTAQAGETKELGDLRIAAAGSKSAPAPPARKNQAEVKTIRGRVLLPDGRAAGETKLSMMRFHWKSEDRVTWERLAAATASAGGEFEIAAPSVNTSPDQMSLLVATAPGFGVQCVGYGAREVSHPLEIKLRRDQPVRGRLLDLEGKPVAGARVRVATITDSLHDDLGPWLAAMKAGVQRYSVAAHALLGRFLKGFPADGGSATTDGDGRFTLTGLGAERIVDLAVESERTAYAVITVATRHMEPIIRPSFPNNAGGLEILGDEFTESLRPTRPVVGVVRDAQTKRPLAGVSVESWHVAGEFFAGQRDVRTSTDAQGRYRLIGLPKGQGNAIFVVPNDEQPYFMRNLDVPDSAGMEAVTVDIELHRGLWITGCVTDKETGQPVLSQINYWPFLDNVFTQGRPEFGPGNTMQGDYARFRTREDGSFRVPGLPGHGLVGAEALSPNYRRGAGAAEIGGFDEDRRLRTFRNQGWPGAKYPTTMKEINPVKGTENVVCNLVCDHGETVRFTVLDPAGQPVNNCALSLPTMTKEGKSRGVDSPFEVNNLSLDTAQPLVIEQKERQLGKFFVFTVKKDSPRSLTVRLEPTTTVAGRLVDQDGVPLSGISVQPMLRRLGDFSPQLPAIVCGSDGRFEYTGLPSGAKVDFQAVGTAVEFLQTFGRMEVKPGKRVDLGEIKLKRRNSATPAATTSTASENPLPAKTKDRVEVNVVHGRVLLPDSKPAAGVTVFALRWYWSARVRRSPLDKTTSNADGTFVVRVPKHHPYDGLGTSGGLAFIAAQADGFGPDWRQWSPGKGAENDVVLKLVTDSPIHGRIVDLEGKPVRGARVNFLGQGRPREPISDWLAALKAGDEAFRNVGVGRGQGLPAYDDESQPPAVTDIEGRFTLKGIGADRLARLELSGETIAYARMDVVTRAIPPIRHRDPFSASGQLFGSDFTFQAAPTQPLTGTVRDAASGAPLAGVSIESRTLAGVPGADAGAVRTQTDAQGQYRLVGLQKESGGGANVIAVVPNGEQPYFKLTWVQVPKAPGLAPVTLDFKLTRGLWITGRATDKTTGKPVPCALAYAPLLSNSLAANLPEFKRVRGINVNNFMRSMARPDGTFRLVGLPGRGLVTAKSMDGRSYRLSGGATVSMTKDGKYPTYLPFETAGADVAEEINPAPGTESVTRDLVFDPGRTVRLSLVDAGGKPVGRCLYVCENRRGMSNGQSNPGTIEVTGMAPHESRPLLIYDPQRHLGKVLVVHEDEKAPQVRTVTLEPSATAKGRLVDAEGVPVKNAYLDASARGEGYWLNEPRHNRSDADGKFQLTDLPPGAEYYTIWIMAPGFGQIAEKVIVAAGKTIDLGEIKLKREK